MKSFFLWSFCVISLVSSQLMAFSSNELDWNGMTDEVLVKGRSFEGQFGETKRWAGLICNGSMALRAKLSGTMDKVDFNMQEDGTVEVYANLTGLNAVVGGNYRSDLSLCATLGLSHPLAADRAEARATLTFIDKGEIEQPDVKVHISEVTLYSLRLSRLLPSFTEEPVTRFANNLLKKVWGSNLGSWIDEKVAKVLKEKLPQP